MTRSLSFALCLFAAVSVSAQRVTLVQPRTPQPAAKTERPPYTATILRTHDQTLADGNTIHEERTIVQAHDSEGRTRRESENTTGKVTIYVTDPVAQTMTSWVVGSNVAEVHSMRAGTSTVGPGTSTAASAGSSGLARATGSDVTVENLGSREILGVEAKGSRTTRTTPAGQEGNSAPLVSTNEIWRSSALNLAMLSINESPKAGRTVVEVKELQQSEPDEALFQPPPEYTIKQDQ
jgi:hypothetical protein